MKRLLRSAIDFEDQRVSAENLLLNFQRLRTAAIEWPRPADGRIYNYLSEFFHSNQELPSSRSVLDFFVRADDVEAQERLKDIEAAQPYVRTNFAHLLKQLVEDQNRIKMRGLVKETEEIIAKGLIIEEGREKIRLQGTKDALLYFTRRANELIPPDYDTQTRGDLRDDTEAAWKEYQEVKLDKGKAWGKFTGLNEIDKVCHGLKKGELWVHAAFAGGLKSTFATTWAYNLVTRYRNNVLYVSLEMPYKQLRRIIYTMHSSNAKFRVQGKRPLDYRQVRDGELDEREPFYKEVLDDFDNNPEYCHFELWCPDRDVTISDIRLEAELKHKEMDVDLIIIDHGGLVEPSRKHQNYTIEQNSIIREAKKMALHFNGGQGVPVLLLFQTNRDGFDYAAKNEGKYKLRALSYANECERSADVISTTFLGEEGSTYRENETTMVCNLKNRDNPFFPPFLAKVDFRCRKLYNLDPDEVDNPGIQVDDDDSVEPLTTMMDL